MTTKAQQLKRTRQEGEKVIKDIKKYWGENPEANAIILDFLIEMNEDLKRRVERIHNGIAKK